MNKEYYESLKEPTVLQNKTAKKLLQYFSPFDAIQTLRRYNVGTAKGGKEAWWYVDENGIPYALTVDNKNYIGEPGIWNIRALTEYNSYRVGVCESPEQAFWANMYLRHYAVWIHCGLGSDLSSLNNKSCFAIVRNRDNEYARLMRAIPGIRFYEYDDFKEELFKTGLPPKRYILPRTKPKESFYQFTERVMNHKGVKKLQQELGLELT